MLGAICLVIIPVARALAGLTTGVGISKSNGYTVLSPPSGVSVSKSNAYVVVGPATKGVSVSKSNAYVVVGPATTGVSVSKSNAYVVVSPATTGVSVSKAVAYVIIAPSATVQPSVFIMTQREGGSCQYARSRPFQQELSCKQD